MASGRGWRVRMASGRGWRVRMASGRWLLLVSPLKPYLHARSTGGHICMLEALVDISAC